MWYYPIINGEIHVKGKRIYRMVHCAREMVRKYEVQKSWYVKNGYGMR